MSIRSAICKSLRDKLIAVLDGTNPDYLTNMYGNVTNKVVHIANVPDYPYMSVTPGAELREDQPSDFTWGFLTVNIRIYVSNQDDAQGELEKIISDVEAFLDENINVDYTVERPSGTVDASTTDITIESIRTDEGLLDPKGLAEIVITVRY
tara:strand:+ start:66 stop:518 length:453 start_codon:yes stop_codon:yes gene_type:complete